jgi:hypothetical protein
MQPDVILIWTGAALVIGGLVFTAAKTLALGRLSEPQRTHSPGPTLEPPTRTTRFQPKGTWPGVAVAGLGAALLLAGALI